MSTLRGPIAPYPRSKAIDRSDARLPMAWECFPEAAGRFALNGPWIDPVSAQASDLAGTYPDGRSQVVPCRIIEAARAVMQRNHERLESGQPQTVTAAFDGSGYRLAGDDV